MATSWTHLIRFAAQEGGTYFAGLDAPLDAQQAPGRTLTGYDTLQNLTDNIGGSSVTIEKLLAPVPSDSTEIVCIGVNYRKHAEEASLTVPLDPVMWYKPKRCLGGAGVVNIPKVAGAGFLDFEGELTIVTAKDARDVAVADAADYILGYTVGNDLTARVFQDPRRAGGQFTRAKNFDGFAPMGPSLLRAAVFDSLEEKRIVTKVNGKVFQNSDVDLIHGAAELISFLSQGVTIPAGTAIMTGSPPGIGYFQEPKYCLKDGDVVEISISGIGTLSNTMVFEQTEDKSVE